MHVTEFFTGKAKVNVVIFVAGQYEVRIFRYGIRHNLEDRVWKTLDESVNIVINDLEKIIEFDGLFFSYAGKVVA